MPGSLDGGTLLVTPLLGADGEVYAVAQGSVAVAGFRLRGRCGPYSARCADGRTDLERRAGPSARSNSRLSEKRACGWPCAIPTLQPRARIASAINDFLGADAAAPGATPPPCICASPENYGGNLIELLTEVEPVLRVEPDQPAKIVVDERSGIIVMGRDVARLDRGRGAGATLPVTITRGTPRWFSPLPFTDGATGSRSRVRESRSSARTASSRSSRKA